MSATTDRTAYPPPSSTGPVRGPGPPDDLPSDLPAELTIAQVADLLDLSPHTLRYYERIGLVDVGRDPSGRRRYDHGALSRVVFVTRLRSSGMPIAVVTRYIELVRQGPGTEPQRLALLDAHRETVRARLSELQTALAVIDHKITTYGGTCGA